MSRLADTFLGLRGRRERALIPFLTAGDPDLGATETLVLAMLEAGADAIELGVPFSDPIAEGPTIQRSSERALAGGASLRGILRLVERLRGQTERPLVLMGYANPFYAMTPKGFAENAAAVGVDGVIVPDLPPEEGTDFYGEAEASGIDPILLAAPTTTRERLALLAERTRGFLYYVSLTGVTGARTELAADIEEGIGRVRETSTIPVCVGFGVSTAAHARALAPFADGVVVGSAIVDRIEAAPSIDAAADALADFVRELKAPLRESARDEG
jgi:tryptophan synthase alpha chain